MRAQTACNQNDLDLYYPLLKELRQHLSKEEYFSIYDEAHQKEGYELVGFFNEKEELSGLMGYRIVTDFVRGRHLYIDDLVTSEMIRSKGVGAFMLGYAEEKSKELKCSGGLRLCTGVENVRGITFYEKNGWAKRAHAFVKKL